MKWNEIKQNYNTSSSKIYGTSWCSGVLLLSVTFTCNGYKFLVMQLTSLLFSRKKGLVTSNLNCKLLLDDEVGASCSSLSIIGYSRSMDWLIAVWRRPIKLNRWLWYWKIMNNLAIQCCVVTLVPRSKTVGFWLWSSRVKCAVTFTFALLLEFVNFLLVLFNCS